MNDETRLFEDRDELCRQAARELAAVLAGAVRDRGEASAVLTGGGTGTGILAALADFTERTGQPTPETVEMPDWRRVHLWWGDERFLPAGDPDRNEVQAHEALLDRLRADHGLPAENIHVMGAAPAAGGGDRLDRAAEDYAEQLLRHARDTSGGGVDERLPVFDVVMLGVGPDAHVASLFPGLPGPAVTGRTVIPVTGSPKPPPERLSLTVEALNTAERLWFVVAGADKAEAVAAVRAARDAKAADADRWPASAVSGRSATTWWLDRAAAGAS